MRRITVRHQGYQFLPQVQPPYCHVVPSLGPPSSIYHPGCFLALLNDSCIPPWGECLPQGRPNQRLSRDNQWPSMRGHCQRETTDNATHAETVTEPGVGRCVQGGHWDPIRILGRWQGQGDSLNCVSSWSSMIM